MSGVTPDNPGPEWFCSWCSYIVVTGSNGFISEDQRCNFGPPGSQLWDVDPAPSSEGGTTYTAQGAVAWQWCEDEWCSGPYYYVVEWGQVVRTAMVQMPPPTPPCRPNLKSGALFLHGYKAHAHSLWPAFPSWITDGANHWNTFVSERGAITPAFTNYVGGTGPLTLDIFVDDTITDWGQFSGGMIGTMRISPRNWLEGTWAFTLSTILHEFGHARNYADAPFCHITETIMYVDENITPTNYPAYFLPGDHRATVEDLALYPH